MPSGASGPTLGMEEDEDPRIRLEVRDRVEPSHVPIVYMYTSRFVSTQKHVLALLGMVSRGAVVQFIGEGNCVHSSVLLLISPARTVKYDSKLVEYFFVPSLFVSGG